MTSTMQGTTALCYWSNRDKNPTVAVEQELKPQNCGTLEIKLHCRDRKSTHSGKPKISGTTGSETTVFVGTAHLSKW